MTPDVVSLIWCALNLTEADIKRFWDNVDKTGVCWIWQGYKQASKHGQVKVNGKAITVHRLAFYLTNGFLPNVVRHRCDNPPCCNPLHLNGGTHAENVLDRVQRNRSAIRERNGRSKLTSQQVRMIRDLHSEGATYAALGRRFGVHAKSIKNIVSRTLWGSVS